METFQDCFQSNVVCTIVHCTMSAVENTVITNMLLAMLMTTDKMLSEVARKVIWVMLVVRVSVLVGQVGGFLGLRGRYITPSTGPSFNDLFALQKC